MSNNVSCERCGKEYEATDALRQLCPVCLFSQALDDDAPATDSASKPDDSPRARFVAPKIAELASHFPQLEILELAGDGGMSAVYKARHIHLNRTVALKLLPKEIADSRGGTERFQRESQTLAQLSHPNIVNVHDAGQAGPWYYIVMEYVDGPNLRQLLGESKLPSPDVLRIAAGICDGLQYAHDRGVVHRDIKPENVLLDSAGGVKLVDFGLAKPLESESSRDAVTGTRQVMGTPHYLAPEQMETPTSVDHRADVYSLGVLMYEMLTGELPLGHFEPPSQRIGSDPNLDAVVLRAMSRDRDQRYQRARDVQAGMASLGNSASAPRTVERVRSWSKAVGELLLLAISFMAIVLGLSVFLGFGIRAPSLAGVSWFAIAVGFSMLLFSYGAARGSVSSAASSRDLSTLQRLCVPIYTFAYAVLGYALLLAPGVAVVLFAGFPLFADVGKWTFLGDAFTESDISSMLTPYWLRAYQFSALASAAWSILIAFVVGARPSLVQGLLHPMDDDTACFMTRAAALVAAAILVFVAFALCYVA